MTPEQHLNHAENLLTVAVSANREQAGPWVMANLVAACCHALIANAAEMGVPHSHTPPGGGEPGGG